MSKASQIRQKAQEFLGKGQIEKAIAEYKRLISVESKNPNLYNELGDIYLRAADKPQAVQNFEKAAVIYEKVALYNNAVAVCKKILRVDPEKPDTIFKLGELRAKQKLEGEATTYFSQFADVILSNPQSALARSQKDVERMLELMPTSEPLLGKAAEIYDLLGLKLKAAELLSKLAAMAVERADPEKHRLYSKKLADLTTTLTADEARQVKTFAAPPPGEAEGANAEVQPAASGAPAPETTAVEPHPLDMGAVPEESQADAVEAAEIEASEEPAHESQSEEPSPEETPESPETEDEDAETVRAAVEEAEMLSAMSRDAEVLSAGTTGRRAEEPARSAAATSAAVAEKPLPTRAPSAEEAPPEGAAAAPASPRAAEAGRGLAEEITSDVEKDDLKSHYDLGMAYLEMGLYNEAIKDFQISSRCQELKLSSMEMIGHCFLKQDNPRLAVKQLTKALEVAHATGGESLGIHYNLGLAHEMLGELERAREHFEEVYIIDMGFREVAEKMRKLGAGS